MEPKGPWDAAVVKAVRRRTHPHPPRFLFEESGEAEDEEEFSNLMPMIVRALALLIFPWLAAALAADAVPSVRAKTEEPVLEELLSGCSLRCAFRWTVEVASAASAPAKAVKTLNDESAQTAWIAPDAGIGTRLRLVFPKKLRAELEGATPVYGLDLINGCWKTEELWEQHARLKRARLYYNRKPFREVQFADSRRWQRIEFPDFFVKSGDSMTIEVLEVYPGKSAPLALTEIVLQGGH
jgi:hypothetical protein